MTSRMPSRNIPSSTTLGTFRSRRAWNQLLGRQYRGYVPDSLSIGFCHTRLRIYIGRHRYRNPFTVGAAVSNSASPRPRAETEVLLFGCDAEPHEHCCDLCPGVGNGWAVMPLKCRVEYLSPARSTSRMFWAILAAVVSVESGSGGSTLSKASRSTEVYRLVDSHPGPSGLSVASARRSVTQSSCGTWNFHHWDR